MRENLKRPLLWSERVIPLTFSPDNVEEWAVICNNDPIGIAFSNELFTYFGIRHRKQIEEMSKNFCSELKTTVDFVKSACPRSKQGKCTTSEFAYWQWASSYFTLNPALELNVPSVALIDDSIFGQPEINYFKMNFMEKTKANANV